MKEIMPELKSEDKDLMEKLLDAGQIKHKVAKRLLIILQRANGKTAREISAVQR
jgi:hypothetical protein